MWVEGRVTYLRIIFCINCWNQQFRTFYQSSHIIHTECVAWNNGNHDGWALAGQQLSDSLKRRPVDSATDDLIHTYVGLSPNLLLDGRDCQLLTHFQSDKLNISVKTKLTAKAHQQLPLKCPPLVRPMSKPKWK